MLALLFFSAFGLVKRLWEYKQSANEYNDISKLMKTNGAQAGESPLGLSFVSPAPFASDALSGTATACEPTATAIPVLYFSDQIRSLKVKNPDTVGYLEIAGTNINYPVVQTSNNSYYQNHTFLKKSNPSGSIFMDSANSVDMNDFNVVLYGHNMKDGSMFHELVQYRKATFAEEHRIITLTCLYEKHTYSVFAAYTCSATTNLRGFSCQSDWSKQYFLTLALECSIINPGSIVPNANDRIITLITCREDVDKNDFVVLAVRLD